MAAKKPRKPKVVRYPAKVMRGIAKVSDKMDSAAQKLKGKNPVSRFIKRRSAEGKESRKVIAARATIREMRSQNEALRAKAKSKAKVKTKPKTKAKK
jgi:putative protein kinase ArgK-like GTPase of G3E family|tara:strand:+ start:426 stop:716 length:291 start_codon:yes stop_codon:yes gene_type:complete